jgi:type IX secretion system PorP/SprF family membrane protein
MINLKYIDHYKYSFLKCLLIMLFGGLNLFYPVSAQEIPTSQAYLFNRYLLNPATSGASKYTSFQLIDRHQWLGLAGAPVTQQFSFHTPVTPADGAGFMLYSDRYGDIRENGVQLSYAHHLLLSKKSNARLSLGTSLLVTQFKVDDVAFQALSSDGVTDPVALANGQVIYAPDIGFGAFFSSNFLFAGLSVSNILALPRGFEGEQFQKSEPERIAIVNGGTLLKINKKLELEPSFAVKFSQSVKMVADANLKLYYMRGYWLGASYKTNHSFSVLTGARYRQFYFGYAFEFAPNEIYSESVGSHEFMIGYSIPKLTRICGRRAK